MIPYIELTSFQIGPITLQVWGLFVAAGFLLAAIVGARLAKRRGLDPKVIYDLTFWSMLAAVLGGRLGYVLFYNPSHFVASPLEIFKVWDGGMSFFGGLFAAMLFGYIYLKKHKLDILKYADIAAFALPFGLWIGRLGCFFIHDHPGTPTNFFLGVQYPDGIIRHDHGLYLSINGLILSLVFLYLAKKERPAGFYVAFFSICYGVVRFVLDFYRLLDVKYFGLTPGQYCSMALIVFGTVMALKIKSKKYE